MRIRHTWILLLLPLLLLAACGGDDDPEGFESPTRTSEPGASSVDIIYPQDGTFIYAEAITITGSVTDSAQQFMLQLVTVDGEVIAESTVDAQPGEWQTEIVHGYTGDPAEIEIRAVPTGESEAVFDQASVLISDISNRPQGAFGTILLPTAGDVLGGDTIPVEGRASGLVENNLVIEMVHEDGRMLSSQFLTLFNPYFVDEVPWQIQLDRQDATGPASITIYADNPESGVPIELDSVTIELTEAAG